MDLSLILFITPRRIDSIVKESKFTAVFQSVNNKTQCVLLLCLSSRFMTYAPRLIFLFFGTLPLEKTPSNLGS